MKQWKVCLECGAINHDTNECLSCCGEDFVVCDGLDAAREASEELREDSYE
jgi:hypothetical protein